MIQEGSNYKVPNVVHYIWFGCKRKFLAYHYLSILSAISVQNACQIFFHTDCEPPEDNWMFQHLKETVILILKNGMTHGMTHGDDSWMSHGDESWE